MFTRWLAAGCGLLVSTFAFGGQIVKNGGAIVVGECYPHQSVYALLDFYEADVLRGWDVSLGNPDGSVEEKVELMLSRVGVLDPEWEARLRGWWETFEAERAWLSNGAELPRVDDTGSIDSVLPPNCVIKQAAGQRIPDNPGFDPYYIFHERHFGSLNTDHKAGLIFHELIYRDGVRRGHTKSVGARFFTSLFATDKVDRGEITPEIFERLLFNNKYDSYWYRNLRLFNVTVETRAEAMQFCDQLDLGAHLPRVDDHGFTAGIYGLSFEAVAGGAIGEFLSSLGQEVAILGDPYRWGSAIFNGEYFRHYTEPDEYTKYVACVWPEEM